jgi:hypothetical protein
VDCQLFVEPPLLLDIFLHGSCFFPRLAQPFEVPSFAMDAVASAFGLIIRWVGLLAFAIIIAFGHVVADGLSASLVLEFVDLFKYSQHQQPILNIITFTS